MIKLCIFDMDGTTVNTINSIAYFANNALSKAGLSPIDTEDYKIIVGNGAKVLVERMIEKVGGDKALFDTVYPEYNTTYDNDFLYLTEPYEGIINMLRELKKQGIKVAIRTAPRSRFQMHCSVMTLLIFAMAHAMVLP